MEFIFGGIIHKPECRLCKLGLLNLEVTYSGVRWGWECSLILLWCYYNVPLVSLRLSSRKKEEFWWADNGLHVRNKYFPCRFIIILIHTIIFSCISAEAQETSGLVQHENIKHEINFLIYLILVNFFISSILVQDQSYNAYVYHESIKMGIHSEGGYLFMLHKTTYVQNKK